MKASLTPETLTLTTHVYLFNLNVRRLDSNHRPLIRKLRYNIGPLWRSVTYCLVYLCIWMVYWLVSSNLKQTLNSVSITYYCCLLFIYSVKWLVTT